VIVRLPAPYDFALSIERYRTFGPDLAYLWRDGALYRAINGREVRIAPAEGGVAVDPPDRALGPRVLRLLGAPFDLDGFLGLAHADPTLRPLAEHLRGFRPPLAPDPFEQLVTAITAQQVSLHAARAIRNRLLERFGTAVGRVFAFPSPERLAPSGVDELMAVGFSRRKAEYTLSLARADLDFSALAGLGDDEVVARLTSLPGIGRWTAEWFLARHLARPDVWPAGDLGLRKAVARLVLGRPNASESEVRVAGERFHPHRNLAAHYLLTGMRVTGR
jgi:3-methyladenine DNA glycosylase/8-oxoguanine DNA glycosylase